ncbi:bacterial regulatory helix-turn-helix, lysR family protein, partial [Vibrio parahaemolyticus V-223/04]
YKPSTLPPMNFRY